VAPRRLVSLENSKIIRLPIAKVAGVDFGQWIKDQERISGPFKLVEAL
jgi:hypothetical protein